MRFDPLSRIPLFPSLTVLLLALSSPLAAAPQVYVDPAGTCNGLTPCYMTLSEAVNNAGPAPARIGVFPGTYAESVDLSTMGSAITGVPGALTIEALDAGGQPTDSGVTIDPGASGGPGTGPGLVSGMGTPFPGDLTIRGLTVTSPDSTAVGLILDGNLIAEDMLVEGSPQIGMIAAADGNVRIERTVARLNMGAGLGAAASGTTTLRDVVAEGNGGTGVAAQGELDVLLERVDSTLNEVGLEAASCNALVLSDSMITVNTAEGGTLEAGTPNCQFPAITRQALDTLGLTFDLERAEGSDRGGALPSITAVDALIENNGDFGLRVLAPDAPATLNSVFSYDNASIGIGIEAGALMLDDVEASRNRSGIFALVDSIDAVRVIANESLPMPANPPVDGAGLIFASPAMVLDDIQTDNNPTVGLLLFQQAPGEPLSVSLVGSQFNGNDIGVAATSDVPIDFFADEVLIENHPTFGMNLGNIGSGELSRLEVTGNGIGLLLDVAESLRVERSQLSNNTTGAGLVVAPDAEAGLYCSDFTGNANGIEMGTPGNTDASANYWGHPSGPTHPGNPGSSGDPVTDSANGGQGTITYTPFLTAPATAADCPVGAPITSFAVPTLNGLGRVGLILLMAWIGMMALITSGTTSRFNAPGS